MAQKRKTYTSTEVSERYKKKAYANYMVRLRRDTDQDLIDFVEEKKLEMQKEDPTGSSTSRIFRDALELYYDSQKGGEQ